MTIIAMNRRFAPTHVTGADPAGVTGFVRQLIRELRDRGDTPSLLLFERSADTVLGPALVEEVGGLRAAVVPFHFGNRDGTRSNVDGAIERLDPDGTRLVYAQSGVYAPFLDGRRAVVTHHGPFVDEVQSALGEAEAINAYLGGREKVVALKSAQARGLDAVPRGDGFRCLEISPIQYDRLACEGVPQDRLTLVPPPRPHLPAEEAIPDALTGFLNGDHDLRILTACARIDAFKNLRELAEAVARLERAEKRTALCIVAGESREADARQALLAGLELPDHVDVVLHPSIAPGQLRRFLSLCGDRRALFCFPSVYETFGLTALQAMQAGCIVLCRDDIDKVGVARFIPSAWRYAGGAAGLAARIAEMDGESAAKRAPTTQTPPLWLGRTDRPSPRPVNRAPIETSRAEAAVVTSPGRPSMPRRSITGNSRQAGPITGRNVRSGRRRPS